jgi:3-oxoacyl-[acyl-carrier-protein] synthase III
VFGDGSGAFVLEKMARRPKGKLELKHVVVRSHPEFIDAFGPIAGFNRLREKGRLEPEDWSFAVRDADAYSALSKVNYDLGASVLADNLASVKWKPDSVTRLLTDNVTKSVGFALAERVGIPEDRVYVDGCRTRGHAFAADMFANMHHSLETNALESKERIVSMGMGLGQHWGLALWQS